MRLREIQSSSTFAWSPLPSKGGLLACGSVAGALGDNFDAEATLEIYSLALEEGGESMPKLGAVRTHDRFNRITWGSITGPEDPYGLIAGGLVDGTVQIWDARAIVEQSEGTSAEVATIDKHKGQVKGVEFNPFNQPLLATAAQDGEWCVWSLTNPSQPQNLGTGVKNPHNSEIVQVSWNKKVPHILAWTSSDGMTAVWDLKQKRQAMAFQDSQNKMRCSSIAWNPDKATDICVANDDDQNPVIQFWDLRKAYSPVRMLSGHTKGVLSLSWSPMDSNLLVSCGKDCRSICWNPNTSEILCELPVSNNWVFDVQWSHRIPAILATASFGENITVYSLQDSSPVDVSLEGTGDFNVGADNAAPPKIFKTAPKWLRRPVGATFGFGGKLVSFSPPPENASGAQGKSKFTMRTVVTEQELVDRSSKFEGVLKKNELPTFCDEKLEQSESEEKPMWSVMKSLLDDAPRKHLLQYLGFDATEIQAEIDRKLTDVDPFAESAEGDESSPSEMTPEEVDQLIQRSLMVGNFESAVKCCLYADRMDDALVLASYGGPDLWRRAQEAYFQKKAGNPFMKVLSSIVDNQLQSVVSSFDAQKPDAWKEALAVLCTFCNPKEFPPLASQVAERLAAEGNNASILAYMAAGDLEKAVECWVTQLDSMDPKKSQEGLQDFIEKVSAFQAITQKSMVTDKMAGKYTEYAELLSSQGCLDGAKRYLDLLPKDCHEGGAVLRDRVFHARVGSGVLPFPVPAFPFNRSDVAVPESAPAPEAEPAVPAQMPPVPVPEPEPAPVQPTQPAVPEKPQEAQQQQFVQQQQYAQQQYTQQQQPQAPQQPYQDPAQVAQQQQQMQQQQYQQQQYQQQQMQQQQMQQQQMQQQQQYEQQQYEQQQQQQQMAQMQQQMAQQQFGAPGYNPQAPQQQETAGAYPPVPTPPAPTPAAAPAMPAAPTPAAAPAPAATGLAAVDTSYVPAQWQPMISQFNSAFARLGSRNAADQKKRPPVEKALTTLYGKLNAGELSPEVCTLLMRFSQVCDVGGSEAKDVIRKLTDAHWDQFKAFKDVKFLSK